MIWFRTPEPDHKSSSRPRELSHSTGTCRHWNAKVRRAPSPSTRGSSSLEAWRCDSWPSVAAVRRQSHTIGKERVYELYLCFDRWRDGRADKSHTGIGTPDIASNCCPGVGAHCWRSSALAELVGVSRGHVWKVRTVHSPQ